MIEISILYSLTVPLIICAAAVLALHKRVDVFSALTHGAKEGLSVIVRILPSLVALLTAVYMLRASGALSALESFVSPALRWFGIPPETAALVFIRPFSGSGALAVGSEIINAYGVDSQIGRTAAVMLGATETTFYVIAVYFGAVGVKKTRHAIPAALCADFAGFFMAALSVRWLF